MNYTSIEQSKKLLELGLRPETADMYWRESYSENLGLRYYPTVIWRGYQYNEKHGDIPCWSTGALIDLLPEEIKYRDEWCSLELDKDWISYESCRIQPVVSEKTPMIVMLCKVIGWLLENNYLNK